MYQVISKRVFCVCALMFALSFVASTLIAEEETLSEKILRMRSKVSEVSGTDHKYKDDAYLTRKKMQKRGKATQQKPTPHADKPIKSVKLIAISRIPAIKGLRLNQESYTLSNSVEIIDGYFVFRLKWHDEVYRIHGLQKLAQFCNEIDSMNRFLRVNQAHITQKDLTRALASENDMREIDLAYSAPEATGARHKLTGLFTKDPKKDSLGTDRGYAGRGGIGVYNRKVAGGLSIDLYTASPRILSLIKMIAKKEAGRRIKLFYSGAIREPAVTLTAAGHDQKTEEMIRDNNPDHLIKKLAPMYSNLIVSLHAKGKVRKAAEPPLKNGNFTPRQLAYIYRYLKDLQYTDGKNVSNLIGAIKFLGKAKTPQEAHEIVSVLEIYSCMKLSGRNFSEFVVTEKTLAMRTKGNNIVVILPKEVTEYSEEFAKFLDRIALLNGERTEIWTIGHLDKDSHTAARRRGFIVKENLLAYRLLEKSVKAIERKRINYTKKNELTTTPPRLNTSDRSIDGQTY